MPPIRGRAPAHRRVPSVVIFCRRRGNETHFQFGVSVRASSRRLLQSQAPNALPTCKSAIQQVWKPALQAGTLCPLVILRRIQSSARPASSTEQRTQRTEVCFKKSFNVSAGDIFSALNAGRGRKPDAARGRQIRAGRPRRRSRHEIPAVGATFPYANAAGRPVRWPRWQISSLPAGPVCRAEN